MRQQAAKARHDRFIALVLKGVSNTDAYRSVYPKSRKWAYDAVKSAGTKLAGVLSVTIACRREAAVTAEIATRQEILKRHTLASRQRFSPATDVLNVTPDGDVSVNLDPEKLKGNSAIREFTCRVEATEKGDGKNDARIIGVKFHDYLPSDKAITDMMGWESPKKHELTGKDGGPIEATVTGKIDAGMLQCLGLSMKTSKPDP